jgi:predicted DNA-binding protein with PD1-like motif
MMQYRREGDRILIRIDKDEEIVQTILDVCRKEAVRGGVFAGIGGCDWANVGSYIPEKGTFKDHEVAGVLEMVSLNGNVTEEDGELSVHAHVAFSSFDNDTCTTVAGHLLGAHVCYTAEILLTVTEPIGKVFDPRAGIMVWDL